MKRLIQMALAGMMGALLVAQEPPRPATAAERDPPRWGEGVEFDWSVMVRRDKSAPVNLSLVLNCSKGSERWFEFTRKAAIELVKDLTTADLVSVVVLANDRSSVLVPAQSVAEREAIIRKLEALKPKGEAAIFAGISAAAAEIRRTKDDQRSNCVLVMGSYGTVGPSSDHDLMTIANALAKEKIKVVMPGMARRWMMGPEGFRGRPGEGDWRARWRERFANPNRQIPRDFQPKPENQERKNP